MPFTNCCAMDSTEERWRLILGRQSDPADETPLQGEAAGIDNTLEALYDSDRKGGLGGSSPNVNRWLGDIRRYFPTPVVQVMQRDALERLELDRMLLEPELLESVEPDVHLVGTLLSLSKILPDRSRETARQVVRRLADEIEKKIGRALLQAVRGSLQRAIPTRRPRPTDIDWHRTIRANLRHYQPEYRTVLPVDLRGYSRRRRQMPHLIILIDQSGSMASSVVYAGILSCILATVPSLRTSVVAFDTSVVDLSEHLQDPVDLLFATQLGGGTDIGRALTYATQLVERPRDTILILLSDLFDGGPRGEMIGQFEHLLRQGVRCLCLLALNDEGAPAFDRDIAASLAGLGLPSFACTPERFPDLLAATLAGRSIDEFTA